MVDGAFEATADLLNSELAEQSSSIGGRAPIHRRASHTGPWEIRIDQTLRERIRPKPPKGWLSLDKAATALGVARQSVLHKVHRGKLAAVHVKPRRPQRAPSTEGLDTSTRAVHLARPPRPHTLFWSTVPCRAHLSSP